MSETLTLTTELEAVNAILASVGESPIVEFDGTFVDAELARNLLREELKAVQTQGWMWNTDLEVTYTPDEDGLVQIPTNLLSVVFDDKDIVIRGRRLYHRTDHTYIFTADVLAKEVINYLPFEECPEAVRRFCYVRAGRRFQDRLQSDNVLHQFQARDEMSAWAAVLNDASKVEQWNMLDNSSLVARLKGNR